MQKNHQKIRKRRIFVPWKQLTKQKGKMVVAIAGIAFADMLMFMQLGIKDALFNGAVQFHNALDGDLVVLSSRYQSLVSPTRFSQTRLYQIEGFSGVQSVAPVYLDYVKWRNPSDRTTWSSFIVGVNPRTAVLMLPGVEENRSALQTPDLVLFDQGSRKEFGTPTIDTVTEVENRSVQVGGLFKMGTSFGINATTITSDINFLRILSTKRKQGAIDLGVVKLNPGVDQAQLLDVMRSKLPNDVKILSKQQFIDLEKQYWSNNTAIGYTFTLGAIIGFVVGAVIVYQILYSDVVDHLPEYATLKAIGFHNRYLLKIVFQEAMILAVLGFLPGFGIASFVYHNMQQKTLLPIAMTSERAVLVMGLTAAMCTISATIAVRKLQAADPADVF